ncbi:hypothetical protein DPMN_153306 [Dreissena polymorpha]|uniref:Uncharacterized protein n=1 Tax=Dreissena polymorpha TaxID=45954 RepID=A0A9D4FLB0_DREPO|nr:hypothetical protein DPMN_153306 [Dreissena polymorpha]
MPVMGSVLETLWRPAMQNLQVVFFGTTQAVLPGLRRIVSQRICLGKWWMLLFKLEDG